MKKREIIAYMESRSENMKVILSDNYYVDVALPNYTLIKIGINKSLKEDGSKSKNYGMRTEAVLGYYSNLAQAVDKFIGFNIVDNNETRDLMQYINEYVETSKQVINKLEKQLKENEK